MVITTKETIQSEKTILVTESQQIILDREKISRTGEILTMQAVIMTLIIISQGTTTMVKIKEILPEKKPTRREMKDISITKMRETLQIETKIEDIREEDSR